MSTKSKVTDPREVGGTYRSGYWGLTYVVRSWTPTSWVLEWEDGRVTESATRWDPRRDRVVSPPA